LCVYIKNITFKFINYKFKPALLPLLQLKLESISMTCKKQAQYISLPLLADGSKWTKSCLQRKRFSLPDCHSVKPGSAGVAGNHVMAAGMNPDAMVCAEGWHRKKTGTKSGKDTGI